MACGPKKHLKLVVVPKQWMLDKLTGVFVPHPSTRPHKLRECLHLIIFLKNGLKYVLTENELKKICLQCFIKTDGKVQTDITYPVGFMDVISTDKTGENFHLIYDTKGCFALHWITPEEAKYKLCKERKIFVGTKGIPHLVIHDVHTICCPDPLIQVNDTIQIDLETGKITDFIKFDTASQHLLVLLNSIKVSLLLGACYDFQNKSGLQEQLRSNSSSIRGYYFEKFVENKCMFVVYLLKDKMMPTVRSIEKVPKMCFIHFPKEHFKNVL
ncbi:hypothetical protein GH733_004822 [Mirounga leonina]|nr:hypothetical protein GH733_004822 [Mirounga leonina]